MLNPENVSNTESDAVECRRKKRKCDPSKWKQNIRKRARQSGEEYVSSRTGLLVPRRRMIMHTCGQCVNRCNEKLTLSQQQDIFPNFWLMSDHTRQRDFICSHVTAKQKKRNRTEKSRRKKHTTISCLPMGRKLRFAKQYFCRC